MERVLLRLNDMHRILLATFLVTGCELYSDQAGEPDTPDTALSMSDFCSGPEPRAVVQGDVLQLNDARFEEYGWSCCYGGALRFTGTDMLGETREVFLTIGFQEAWDQFAELSDVLIPFTGNQAPETTSWFWEGRFTEPDTDGDPLLRFSSQEWQIEGSVRNDLPWRGETATSQLCMWATSPGSNEADLKLYVP